MKPYTINCPSCGAGVNLEKDVPHCFCPYCGTQIIVDDGVQRSEIVYRDEAKILELQLKEQARIRAVEAAMQEEDKYKQKRKKKKLILLSIIMAYVVLCVQIAISSELYRSMLIAFLISFFIPIFYPYEDDGKNIFTYFAIWAVVVIIGIASCSRIAPLISSLMSGLK